MQHLGLKYEDLWKMFDPEQITPFSNGGSQDKKIYLRHDVDSSIIKALPMALYEHKMGIKSTYFILHFKYWHNDDTWFILRDIRDMGHEIGFHNSVVTEVIKYHNIAPGGLTPQLNKEIRKRLRIYLRKMRSEDLNIRGTCEHGDRPCYTHTIRNRQVWDIYPPAKGLDQYSLESFGLEYDCSYVNALKEAEKYGLENTETHNEIFVMDTNTGWYGHTPEEAKRRIRKKEKYIIHFNIHPERWL